jgi:DNA-binding transcriptional ArsR family regulator
MGISLLNALAEPNRFHIVELLREKPRSVNEVAHELDISQPQASKHLKYLTSAGVVKMQPAAQKRIYRLKPEPFLQLDDWLKSFEQYWGYKLSNLDHYLNNLKKG